jgi:hypothetical protein
MKFVVILMLLNFLLTLVLCVGVGYLAFYQPEKNIPQQKQKQERKWEPEPPIKQETSLNTKNKIEPVTKQNETTPIDEKTIPKNETEIEIEIESKTEPEPETESESESETEKPIE